MRRRTGVSFISFLLASSVAMAQSVPPPAKLDAGAIEKALAPVVAKALDDAGTPGAVVVVVQNGQIVFSKGYGFANYEKKTPVEPERTLFYLASVTKTFTATAVMQLVEQGKLRLDADVNTYLTKFKVPATFPQPVTLHHLLTHTAGFDDKNIGYVARTAAETKPLGDFLASDLPPRVRVPGVATAYSNHSFGLAGYIVESVSGEPYVQYIERHILQPLGMAHSTVQVPPPAHLLGDLAPGHQWSRAANGPVAQPLGARNLAPAGSLSATGADMARYMIAHLQLGRMGDARILQEESARTMQRQQFTHHPELPGIGYAFYHWRLGNLRLIEHGGSYVGYATQMTLIPEHNAGIFVATNGSSASVSNAIVTEILRTAFQAAPSPAQRLSQPSSSFVQHLRDLNGAYHLTRYSRHTIEKVAIWDGQIQVDASHDGSLTLAPRNRAVQKYFEVAPLVFENEKGDRIAFVVNAGGRVSHFAMTIPVFHFPAAFEKLPWWEGLRVQLGAAFSCMVVFASTITLWPLAALGAMLYRRWRKLPGPQYRTPRWAIAASVASGLLGLTFVAGLDVMLGNSAYRNQLVYGMTPGMNALMWVPVLQLALVPILLVAALNAIRETAAGISIRAYLSAVALASALFALLLWNLNLVGF